MSIVSILKSTLKPIIPSFIFQRTHIIRKKIQKLRFSFFEKTVDCDVLGNTIKIGVSSDIEKYRTETYSTKEPETLNWLKKNLQEGDVFYDIGANIGLYSLYAAKLHPHIKIFAFEPESQNFARLCKNLILNHATQVIPCSFPLTDREIFDYFFISELKAGCAFHEFGSPNQYRWSKETEPFKQGALGVSLDWLVNVLKVPAPTLLKIDVDGIEEKILAGGSSLITQRSIRSILIEVTDNNGEKDRVINLFKKAQYQLTEEGEELTTSNGSRSRNLIFDRIS